MEANKDRIGQVFFTLSILVLIYMLISPLMQVITNINEFFTLTVIHFPMSDLLHILGGEMNPPLYFILLKALAKLANDFAILKVFSVVPYAIILILSIIKLKKDYGWLTAGLFAFAIAMMSEFFITYSILRPYSWAMLFIILAFICFKDIITTADKKSFILFTIFSVLASYTHYYGLITATVLYLISLFHILIYDRDKIKYWAISIVAGIIIYAPWVQTLINLLQKMKPLGDLTTDSIIQSFAHFAYSGDTTFSIITLLVFAVILLVYLRERDSDTRFVLYGVVAYFATIALVILISILIKPIFFTTGLVLASAILWLVISIMIGKIQSKRILLITLALVCMILVSGIGTMISSNDVTYKNGLLQNEVLDSIVQDNDSIVILNNPGLAMYFLDLANQTDMYCVYQGYIYGENIDRIHQIFDFKNINKEDIDDLAYNNTDKNIYLVSWGQLDTNITTVPILKQGSLVISKANVTNPYYDEYGYYDEYEY